MHAFSSFRQLMRNYTTIMEIEQVDNVLYPKNIILTMKAEENLLIVNSILNSEQRKKDKGFIKSPPADAGGLLGI